MRILLFVIAVFVVGQFTFAKEVTSLRSALVPKRSIKIALAYGSELRPQQNVEANFKDQHLSHLAIGLLKDDFLYSLERAELSEASGNASLHIQRKFEDVMFWAQYRSLAWKHIVPTLGAGVGWYQEYIQTNLLGESRASQTNPLMMAGASFGLSTDFDYVWASLEGRFIFGDQMERQGAFGALTRIGVWF